MLHLATFQWDSHSFVFSLGCRLCKTLLLTHTVAWTVGFKKEWAHPSREDGVVFSFGLCVNTCSSACLHQVCGSIHGCVCSRRPAVALVMISAVVSFLFLSVQTEPQLLPHNYVFYSSSETLEPTRLAPVSACTDYVVVAEPIGLLSLHHLKWLWCCQFSYKCTGTAGTSTCHLLVQGVRSIWSPVLPVFYPGHWHMKTVLCINSVSY